MAAPTTQIKILLVDPSNTTSTVISKLLHDERDMKLRTCAQAKLIGRIASQYEPDVILVTLGTDGSTGPEALTTIRADASIQDTPIIALSGERDEALRYQALAAGADDYITSANQWLELSSRIRGSAKGQLALVREGLREEPEAAAGKGPAKVLMVDDSELLCKGVAKICHGERNLVFTYCNDPFRAREIARTFAPSVILLDLEMPGMSGLDLLRHFRKDANTQHVPVIILSSIDDPAIKAQAFALGANDYVEKKMDRVEILGRIRYHNAGYLNALMLNKSLRDLTAAKEQLEVQRNFIRQTFGRYVSDEVVDNLLESPDGLELGGEQKTVAIMMTDLRGFTSLGERLPPEAVVAMINIYLGGMTDVLVKYQGTIDEFIGDAILALFGAPVTREDDAKRAVACAVEMQLAMSRVNALNRQNGYPEVQQGIGLNFGEAVVGNVGSAKRLKYGIVGRNVNLAARIESYSVGGQILVSESIVDAVGKHLLRVDDEMVVEPKGVKEPITIYDIGGISGSYNLYLPEKKKLELTPLRHGLPVGFTILEGKHAGTEVHRGVVAKMHDDVVEIQAEVAADRLANLKLTLFDKQRNVITKELYCKVIEEVGATPPTFRVRFTAITPEAEAFLQQVMHEET